MPLLPVVLHPEIRSSRYYAANSNALVIQSDESRKQTDNIHGCYRKLHQLIVDAGKSAVPGETSEEQKERVRKLYVLSPPLLFLERLTLRPEKKQAMKPGSRRRNSTAARRVHEGAAVLTIEAAPQRVAWISCR